MISRVGIWTVRHIIDIYTTMIFFFRVISLLFHKPNYATYKVIIKQIYFTSIQILPTFIFFTTVFGALMVTLIVDTLMNFGIIEQMGSIIIGVICEEFAPIFIALFLSIRTSSAINTEIAIMKINGELDTLKSFGIDEHTYIYMPRLIGTVISTLFLSTIFSIIAILAGFVLSKIYIGIGFDMYIDKLIDSIEFFNIILLLIKMFLFGILVSLVPIFYALKATTFSSIPIVVLNGMVNTFLYIIISEVIILIIKFI